MRVIVQRSGPAYVSVEGEIVGAIDTGLVLLVGIKTTDVSADAEYLAEKLIHLRIFDDESGRMNHDILTAGGAVLSVSQFTLYGDARKGRRPDYTRAADAKTALELYDSFNTMLRERGLTVATGRFGAMMKVSLVNDGPVTILLDSERQF